MVEKLGLSSGWCCQLWVIIRYLKTHMNTHTSRNVSVEKTNRKQRLTITISPDHLPNKLNIPNSCFNCFRQKCAKTPTGLSDYVKRVMKTTGEKVISWDLVYEAAAFINQCVSRRETVSKIQIKKKHRRAMCVFLLTFSTCDLALLNDTRSNLQSWGRQVWRIKMWNHRGAKVCMREKMCVRVCQYMFFWTELAREKKHGMIWRWSLSSLSAPPWLRLNWEANMKANCRCGFHI